MELIFSDNWLNLVFAGRNQQYGAFELRKRTPKNYLIAVFLSFFLLGTFIGIPAIINLLLGHSIAPSLIISQPINLTNVDVILPPIKLPAVLPPSTPPPSRPSTAFHPQVIRPDEQVMNDLPPAQTDLHNTEPGSVTQNGDPTGLSNGATEAKGPAVAEDPDIVYTLGVQLMPEFPGGDMALLQYIRDNVVYPVVAKENDIEGTVYVQFVINKVGNVTDVKLAHSVDRFLDKEALRVITSMPHWKPGKQNGKAVSVEFTVPIRFELH